MYTYLITLSFKVQLEFCCAFNDYVLLTAMSDIGKSDTWTAKPSKNPKKYVLQKLKMKVLKRHNLGPKVHELINKYKFSHIQDYNFACGSIWV
jgi:hypothetical protein